MTNSRRKGKAGELEASHFIEDCGWPARRGAQHRGGPGSPDVIADTPFPLHIEVKRGKRIDIYGALAQAARDAGDLAVPIAMVRRDHFEWVVVLRAGDFFGPLMRAAGEP